MLKSEFIKNKDPNQMKLLEPFDLYGSPLIHILYS